MNKVILIGRLSKDPELRTTASNLSVATFSIAVSRPVSANGEQGTDFINCVIWRRQAENLAKYCHKGSQIAVEGRIQTRNYTAQDGSKRYVTEVLCDNVTFLGTKSDNAGQSNYQNDPQSYQPEYSAPTPSMPEADISEDPFKDFGEEITLSDDDLPF